MDSSRDRNILTASPPTEDNPNIPPIDNCPLLDTVPAEIRNYIYELALVDQDDCCVIVNKEDLVLATALSRTCRQIRDESKNIVFSNSFAIRCGEAAGNKAADWLLSLDDKIVLVEHVSIFIDLSAEIDDEIKSAAEAPDLALILAAQQDYTSGTPRETVLEQLRDPHHAAKLHRLAAVEKQDSARIACFELANRATRKLGNTICTALEDGKLAQEAVYIEVPEELAGWDPDDDDELVTRELMLAYMFQVLFIAVLDPTAREWEKDVVDVASVRELRNDVVETEVWNNTEKLFQMLQDWKEGKISFESEDEEQEVEAGQDA